MYINDIITRNRVDGTAAPETSYGYQDGALRGETVYDGLGRVSQTRQYETASNYIVVDTTYDAMGRKHSVSNPHRVTPLATDGITTYGYDALSCVRTVTAPDGSVTNSSYWGNQTTVWDPANKQRRNTTDALGRLTQVDEMQEYPSTAVYATTTYGYDVLDDLTTVNQGGPSGQHRTFNYDSLKRLTSAGNPESGTTSYPLYDGNGNLMTKTDARNVTTHYTYDALNRILTKSYDIPQGSGVAPTAPVSYCYDTASNGVGRPRSVTLASGCTGDGSYFDAYDEMGRVTMTHHVTDGQTYGSSPNPTYAYNLAGELTAETYPSGRKVTTAYDPAGRVNAVTGEKAGETNRSYTAMPNSSNFWPHGAVQSMNLGNGLVESAIYNNRLQPTQISLGNLASFGYTYGTGDNNGNVVTQQIITPALNVTQGYCYDKLNRLTGIYEPVVSGQCQTSGWSQMYDYDQYGNRTNVQSPPYLSNPPTVVPAPAIDSSTNRFQAGTGFGYDNAGNLTQAPSGVSYSYDAENRLTNFSNGTATYAYDGDGRRVKKTVQSAIATTVFVYNVLGQLVAEYCSGSGCNSISGTEFLTADHLGSTRVVTDASGGVISRHDYLPFGEAISTGIGGRTGAMGYEDPDGINQKFTGKERDSESGLDYFLARYHSSALGRFACPDLLGGHLEDPQTLNKYLYTRNNPVTLTDPTGLDFYLTCQKESDTCKKQTVGYDKNGEAQTALVQGTLDDKGNFTATKISNDQSGNLVDQNGIQYTAKVGPNGVSFSPAGVENATSSSGVFVNGTSPTTIQGSGDFRGFTFTFQYSQLESNQTAAGIFSFAGTPEQAGAALERAGLWNMHALGVHAGYDEYRTTGHGLF
ncbi:MAG: hypothetical protein LAO21_14900 [Acidobacteriia bacterium]|nr:hypothetical protein [Terriglobia bacterium]